MHLPTTLRTSKRCNASAERSPSVVLLCLSWPEEFGGRGRNSVGNRLWCARRCGHTTSRAVRSTWVLTGSGPTLMRYGTVEQQRNHLPPIARGEVIWCQGFLRARGRI